MKLVDEQVWYQVGDQVDFQINLQVVSYPHWQHRETAKHQIGCDLYWPVQKQIGLQVRNQVDHQAREDLL
jgi:hypothetical protein